MLNFNFLKSKLIIGFLLVSNQLISAPQDIAINEVFYLGNNTQDWVELINRGNDPVDISGWQWCARFSYRSLGSADILSGNADLLLDPGEIIALSVNMDLNNSASDLGIYTSSPFGNASNMVDFVQWNTATDVGRSDVARDKGIWLQFLDSDYDFVDIATNNETLNWCQAESGGGFLTTSMDFYNGQSSQGAGNDISICSILFANGFEGP